MTHTEFADSVSRIDINDNIGQINSMLTRNKNIFLNILKGIKFNSRLILKCYIQKLKISREDLLNAFVTLYIML